MWTQPTLVSVEIYDHGTDMGQLNISHSESKFLLKSLSAWTQENKEKY